MSNLPLSPECRLVFLTAIGESGDAEIRQLLHGQLDWDRVLFLAALQKASASLFRTIESISAAHVPATVMEQLRRQALVSDFHMTYLKGRLQETLHALRSEDIRVMMLKGAALGASAYQSFTERPMADVDLLLHPEDTQAATRILHSAGWTQESHPERAAFYEHHHHLPPFSDTRGSGHKIELHIRAFAPPNPFGAVEGEMWGAAIAAPPEYAGALVPSREHLLVYACVHFAWSHRLEKGAWRTIRDVHQLSADGLDWIATVAAARRWRARTACYWTLRVAQRVAGVAVPREVLDSLRPTLPAIALDTIERHFLSQIVPGERAPCPSEGASQFLWRTALRPRLSASASREEKADNRIWEEGESGAESCERGGVLRQLRRSGDWWRYLRDLVSGHRREFGSLSSLR